MKTVSAYLLSKKANPNFFNNFQGVQTTSDPEHLMPLHQAVKHDSFGMVQLLTQNGHALDLVNGELGCYAPIS